MGTVRIVTGRGINGKRDVFDIEKPVEKALKPKLLKSKILIENDNYLDDEINAEEEQKQIENVMKPKKKGIYQKNKNKF